MLEGNRYARARGKHMHVLEGNMHVSMSITPEQQTREISVSFWRLKKWNCRENTYRVKRTKADKGSGWEKENNIKGMGGSKQCFISYYLLEVELMSHTCHGYTSTLIHP